MLVRRGGRVAECAGLENRYTRKGIESSNLSLSAFFSQPAAVIDCGVINYGDAFASRNLPRWSHSAPKVARTDRECFASRDVAVHNAPASAKSLSTSITDAW